jgi:tetratricopeptide (TPR) repeat protein
MNQRMWWGGALAALWFAAVPAWADEPEGRAGTEAADADEGDMADAMFDFLMAEVAAQRGDLEGALGIYQRLARELKDPRVARRAIEAAIQARDYPAAMDSGALLLELDPESSLAREIIAALLGNEGDLTKATGTVSRLLEKSHDRAGMLTQLAFLFGKFQDKAAVLEATRTVTARYPAMPESHYALGVAALVANRIELAGQEADAAIATRPGWEQGAILKAQVLRKVDPHAVGPFYEAFVDKHPASAEVRMQLGRELAADHKLAEAREQFRAAEKIVAKDSQPAYAIGLLSLQLEDFAEAQASFTRALKLGYRDPAAIYLGMGQASEGLKHVDEAIGWYQKVESGDWVRAQLKIATLISKEQGLVAGREYLHRIEPRTDDDRIQMVQVEAQLLRDAKAWRETYEMLSKAVEQYPESF